MLKTLERCVLCAAPSATPAIHNQVFFLLTSPCLDTRVGDPQPLGGAAAAAHPRGGQPHRRVTGAGALSGLRIPLYSAGRQPGIQLVVQLHGRVHQPSFLAILLVQVPDRVVLELRHRIHSAYAFNIHCCPDLFSSRSADTEGDSSNKNFNSVEC